jgi:hypothetical protein
MFPYFLPQMIMLLVSTPVTHLKALLFRSTCTRWKVQPIVKSKERGGWHLKELSILSLACFVKFISLLNERMHVVHVEENWILDKFCAPCFLIKLHGMLSLSQEILKASVNVINYLFIFTFYVLSCTTCLSSRRHYHCRNNKLLK